MRTTIALAGLLACMACAWTAGAQTAPAAAAGADTAPAAAAGADTSAAAAVPDYRLGANDVFSITVMDQPDLSKPEVIVPPDGNVSLPLLKEPVNVLNLTIPELTNLLTQQYRTYLVNPNITITLMKKRQEFVTLAGYAGAGTMDYHANMHISELLAQRTSMEQSADFSKITVTHKDGTKQTLDLTNLAQKADTDADILLRPGDIVFVPQRIAQYSVLGEVNNPGSFDYRDGTTILTAIQAAGNVKDTADLGASTVTQNGREDKVDLYALLRQGDMSQNRAITPGTSIMIPEIHNRTYIFGEVTKPGYYNYKPGDRILDALNSAAPLQTADLRRVTHIHVDKQTNTATAEIVNVMKFLSPKPDLKANVSLAPGDVLYIPARHKGFSISDIFGALSGLSLVDNAAHIFVHGLGANRY